MLFRSYDPLFLGAWERNPSFPDTVVPRADVKLALRTVRKLRRPLGRGVWVFDASDTNNWNRRNTISLMLPEPEADFEARTFGPFLVIRTKQPTETGGNYFVDALRAELVGKSLWIGDADINYATALAAAKALDAYPPPRSLSMSSR